MRSMSDTRKMLVYLRTASSARAAGRGRGGADGAVGGAITQALYRLVLVGQAFRPDASAAAVRLESLTYGSTSAGGPGAGEVALGLDGGGQLAAELFHVVAQ